MLQPNLLHPLEVTIRSRQRKHCYLPSNASINILSLVGCTTSSVCRTIVSPFRNGCWSAWPYACAFCARACKRPGTFAGFEPTLALPFEVTSESGCCPAFEDSAALILLKTPQIVRSHLDDVQLGRRAY